MSELDPVELEQFNTLVDNITDDIEAGRTKANPLASTSTIGEIVVEEKEVTMKVTVKEEAPDMGEQVMEEGLNEAEAKASAGMPSIIGKVSKKLVSITDPYGNRALYGSAVAAAEKLDPSATFFRKYCKEELTDKLGNSYKYIEEA